MKITLEEFNDILSSYWRAMDYAFSETRLKYELTKHLINQGHSDWTYDDVNSYEYERHHCPSSAKLTMIINSDAKIHNYECEAWYSEIGLEYYIKELNDDDDLVE